MAARRHQHVPARAPHPEHLERRTLTLADGAVTTLHVARHDPARMQLRVVVLPRPTTLATWCARSGVAEALVGGFYVRPHGTPLGELRTGGVLRTHEPFDAPWGARRACVHIASGEVRIARRDEISPEPPGDLLQAGPLLVRDGGVVVGDDEGFAAGAGQFDSDITAGRHPRAALGVTGDGELLAVAVDGRADGDCGVTISELASALIGLGARSAINLDGGGSTTLICGGHLVNVPREAHEVEIAGGRAVSTALVFTAR